MPMIMDNQQILIKLSSQAAQDLQELMSELKTDAGEVFSQALNLLKHAQGRLVKFEDKKQNKTWQINSYVSTVSITNLK